MRSCSFCRNQYFCIAQRGVGQEIGRADMTIVTSPASGKGTASNQGWVLVIVRELRLRQLLLTILGQAGYALIGCATLAESKPVVAQHGAPRLIIFDGSSASEEKLREQLQEIELLLPPGTSCRLAVLSLAHPLPRLHELPGADALIAKPFELKEVLDKVAALMQS